MNSVSPVRTPHGSGVGPLGDHDGDRLRGVARRGQHLERHLPEGQSLPVGQRIHGELRLGRLAVADGGAGGGGDLQVAGEEVGVEVRLDDPLDVQAGGLGVGQVLRDVALGVDDDGPAGRLVADEVAEEGETSELVLAEEHRPPPFRWGPNQY